MLTQASYLLKVLYRPLPHCVWVGRVHVWFHVLYHGRSPTCRIRSYQNHLRKIVMVQFPPGKTKMGLTRKNRLLEEISKAGDESNKNVQYPTLLWYQSIPGLGSWDSWASRAFGITVYIMTLQLNDWMNAVKMASVADTALNHHSLTHSLTELISHVYPDCRTQCWC